MSARVLARDNGSLIVILLALVADIIVAVLIAVRPDLLTTLGLGLGVCAGVAFTGYGFLKHGRAFAIPYLLISDVVFSLVLPFSLGWNQTTQRLLAFAVGGQIFLLAFLLIQPRHIHRTRELIIFPYERWMLLFFVGMNMVGLINGLVSGCDKIYLIGDTYKLLMMPVVYYLAIYTLPRRRAEDVFRMMLLIAVLTGLRTFVTLVRSLISGGRLPATAASVVMIVYTTYRLCNSISRREGLGWLLVSALFAFNTLMGLTRWANLYLMLGILIPVLLQRKGRIIQYYVALTCGVILLGGLLYLAGYTRPLDAAIGQVTARIQSTYRGFQTGVVDESIKRREVEVRAVYQQLVDAHPIRILMGFGNGAEYNPYRFLPLGFVHYAAETHNIHNTFASVLLRLGVVGLGLFLVFCVSTWKQFFSMRGIAGRKMSPGELVIWKSFLIAFPLYLMIAGNVGHLFIGELQWAVLLGLMGQLAARGHEQIWAGSVRAVAEPQLGVV